MMSARINKAPTSAERERLLELCERFVKGATEDSMGLAALGMAFVITSWAHGLKDGEIRKWLDDQIRQMRIERNSRS